VSSRIAIVVGIAVVITLSASGCATASDNAGAEPTPLAVGTSPSPTESVEPVDDSRGATYLSLEEFRADLELAGVPCPTLVDLGQNPNAAESGFCEDHQWLLSTFVDIDARNAVLQLNVDSIEPGMFLVGPNWLLASADQQSDLTVVYGNLQPALGGVVWDHTQPFPT